jgi:hypothetical protein
MIIREQGRFDEQRVDLHEASWGRMHGFHGRKSRAALNYFLRSNLPSGAKQTAKKGYFSGNMSEK